MRVRYATVLEVTVLEWLNDLRELGTLDMFKVLKKIESKNNVSNDEAKRLLALWVRNFNDSGAYDEVIKD